MNYGLKILLTAIYTLLSSSLLTYLLWKYLRHSNKEHPPTFGGLAIFISFWTGFFALFPALIGHTSQSYIFLSSLTILITGMFDDYLVLKPWQKSLGILLAANMVYFLTEVEFSSILLPNLSPLFFRIISYILTILWIYFVTNAVNLLDGVDGLAGSVSLTSLFILALTSLLFSSSIRLAFLMLLLLLFLAILGFLPFNWSPARIYLGDTGALFIGFMYAALSVTHLKNASFFTMILPIFVYVVPLFDTSYAIFRRLLTGQSIVQRDQDHVHHRLTRLGYSNPKIVGIMVGITIVFAILAISAQQFRAYRSWIMGATLIIVLGLSWWMYHLGQDKP